MNTTQKLISELKKYKVSEVDIAAKLKVSYSAVYSWVVGRREPSHFVEDKLRQILRGYKSAWDKLPKVKQEALKRKVKALIK